MGMVYVSTIAYNAEKTLCRCIDSVLNQTYGEFIYYICDNGSTDKTAEILRAYAEKDPRIRMFSNLENNVWNEQSLEYAEFRRKLNDDDYICNLDSDDEYAPAFLEEMLGFLKLHQLDVAVCGSSFIQAADGRLLLERVLPGELFLLSPSDFLKLFPVYHQFMRTLWGKLYTGKAAKNVYTIQTKPEAIRRLTYGDDTLSVFSILRHVRRVGIAPRVLHRYYVSQKSSSYKYNPSRFDSDVYLYNDAIDFLSAYGPISPQNRNFLQCVYSNAVFDTTGVIQNAALSPTEKLREYRRIVEHPITKAAYRECKDESAVRSRTLLLQRALQVGADLRKKSGEDLQAVVQALCPRCGRAVTAANAPLFLESPPLFRALIQDDPDMLLQDLLERMQENQGVKKYDIPKSIQALTVDNPLLSQIDDAVFLRKYGQLYRKVWEKDELSALDEMTGLLLEDRISGGREAFLQLYISLAAALEHAPAFVFGKTRLAGLYLRQARLTDCRAVLNELAEMGVENEELTALRQGAEMDS